MGIEIERLVNFLLGLKSEFEDRFTDLDKIEVLNNCFS